MRFIPLMENFEEFIRNYKGSVILVMHSQADLDALGSTIAMINLITHLNKNLDIRVLEPDLSSLSNELMKSFSYQFKTIKTKEIDPPILFFFIDINQINSELIIPDSSYIIIDHHIPNTLDVSLTFDFRFPSFRATAEIISCLYHQIKVPLTPNIIRCLIAGILFDTKRFLYADLELFECVIYLISHNPEIYSEVQALFSSSRSYSERTACIKAAQRMKRYQISNKILLFSHVSSYEAAAARALISLGGDIAVVIAKRKSEARISLRATPEFYNETGISLGQDIVPILISQFGGTGGGHDAAAGYNTEQLEIREIKNFLYSYLEKRIENNNLVK